MTLARLRENAARRLAALPSCACGFEREPRRVRTGGMSLLVCDRCGGLTYERKEA